MTEGIWIAIIVAVPPTLMAIVNYFKTDSMHKQINSRQDEWVKTAVAAAVAAALTIERERLNAAVLRRNQETD